MSSLFYPLGMAGIAPLTMIAALAAPPIRFTKDLFTSHSSSPSMMSEERKEVVCRGPLFPCMG